MGESKPGKCHLINNLYRSTLLLSVFFFFFFYLFFLFCLAPAPVAPENAEEAPKVVETPKKEEAPKAEVKPAAAPAKPKPVKKEATEKPTAAAAAAKADAVAEDLDALDDEIVADLYGKEHLNVVFMGHVGKYIQTHF